MLAAQADRLRAAMIERIDDAFADGEIAALLDRWSPCLLNAGHQPLELLAAVQRTLFPESFLPPEGYEDSPLGLLTDSKRIGGSRSAYEILLESSRDRPPESPQDREDREREANREYHRRNAVAKRRREIADVLGDEEDE